jgi:response regulator of citrate/malate metabolism
MKSRKKKFHLKRKAWVESDMMESEVYRSLSSKAMWALQRFYQKRTWSDVKIRGRKKRVYENGGLSFTYTEAKYYGISKAQFHRILKILVEKGFIDVEYRGGGLGRDYSRYALSERWRKWGTPEFKKRIMERVLQAGMDVQSRKAAKLKKAITDENP